MNDELIIGGVTMPTLKLDGLTITKEKNLVLQYGTLCKRGNDRGHCKLQIHVKM